MVATTDSIKLRKYRRIIWYVISAFFFFGILLVSLGFDGANPIVFWLTFLMLLYALQLGSRIRRTENEQNMLTAKGGIKASKPLILIQQVGPPLLLLPLFMASFDATWLFVWIAGVISVLISAFSLLTLMVRNDAGGRFFRWETMTRPLLTILIVSGAYGVGLMVQASSERYAKGLVAALQRACKEQGRCPAAPEGWQLDGRYAQGDHRRVRATHGHWSFIYVTNPERSEFELWIRKATEVEKCAHGGSSIVLSERDSLFCVSDTKLPLNSFVDSK